MPEWFEHYLLQLSDVQKKELWAWLDANAFEVVEELMEMVSE
jgi:hypothetical protein